MACRDLRYDVSWWKELHDSGADRIAVAHNADIYNVETLFLNLSGDPGVTGLRGMLP